MIYDYFARQARETPDAIATIGEDGTQNSYLKEFQFLNALMVALKNACPDLARQQPIGVAFASRRLHMHLLFALEALGITTMNYVQPIDPGVIDTVDICGLFMGEHRPANAREFFRIDQAFFDAVALMSGTASTEPAIWDPEKTVRLVTTSGSTGRSKIMPLSYRAQRTRVERRVWLYGITAQNRLLLVTVITVPLLLSMEAIFSQGGAAIFLNPARLLEQLAMATSIVVLPIHLSELLNALPPGYVRDTPLKILCSGAELGPALRASAVAKLGPNIICPYATNEAGTIAIIGADGIGTILPDVEVEVIDENFKVLPYGMEGRIRIRSAEVVQSFLDPELSREHFVDGWFLPGDLGVMPQAGQIRYTGRSQAVLNFGGVKYSPEVIEQLIAAFAKAEDVAVCGRTNADGIDELQIAVVNSQLDDQTLATGIKHRMGHAFAAIHLFRVSAIPRNASGKVQRQLLSEQLKQP